MTMQSLLNLIAKPAGVPPAGLAPSCGAAGRRSIANFNSAGRIVWLFLIIATVGFATPATWHSLTLDLDVALKINEPVSSAKNEPKPLVIYLTHLAAPRVGTESDESILANFNTAGYLIAELDYANNPKARMPGLTRDLIALRSQLQRKTFLTDRAIDRTHVFIVPSGCRLKRDVVFYRDSGRTFAMDIIYPSQPKMPVGAVLEFSCDNANRMSNGSLDFCTDTLLPGAAIEGFAAVMADHPVAAPYTGFDPMPDCARKIKAAARTLRAQSDALTLNGRIIPLGFSRGSGMALMALTVAKRTEFDGFGEHGGTDSSVQGAVIMSGRFTYLDLLPRDKMIARYERTWGPRKDFFDVWRAQGALDYLDHRIETPLFLTINSGESPDALHQMDVLRRRLTEFDSPFTYAPEPESRGHKMPLNSDVLENLFHYLHEQLSVAPVISAASLKHP